MSLIKASDFDKKPAIYTIRFGDKYYIGSTSNVRERFTNHLGNLSNKTHRNRALQEEFDKNPALMSVDVQYVSEAVSREELFERENLLIYKAKDDPDLLNYSVNNNPWMRKSPEEIEKAFKRLWIPVTVDGISYDSMLEALNALGIRRGSLTKRLDSPYYPTYYRTNDVEAKKYAAECSKLDPDELKALFDEQLALGRAKANAASVASRSRGVVINEVEYSSRAEAARELGISSPGIANRIHSPIYPNYYWLGDEEGKVISDEWFSLPESERDLILKKRLAKSKGYTPVLVKGVVYLTASEAAKALGYASITSVTQKNKSDKYPDFCFA